MKIGKVVSYAEVSSYYFLLFEKLSKDVGALFWEVQCEERS